MKDSLESNRSLATGLLMTCLLAAPLLVVAAKHAPLPAGEWLHEGLSLEALPTKMQRNAIHILFLPLAAVAVVFFRLTLGIRVLGPFRSILLAWSFRWTGIWMGTLFLLLTVAVLVIMRRPVRKLKLPYFARITLMLSGVAVVMIGFLLASTWLGADWMHGIAHLPIVVLCLISEAFADVLRKEGPLSAVWRMFTTVLLGMIISLLAAWPALGQTMLHHPELLFVQIGLIIVIGRFAKWKLLAGLNPGSAVDDDEESTTEEIIGRRLVAADGRRSGKLPACQLESMETDLSEATASHPTRRPSQQPTPVVAPAASL